MSPVVRARNVVKEFVQIADRPESLKSYLINFLTGKWRSNTRRTTRVLDGVSFDIFPGEIVGIMGRNGTGKSTLVRLLSGIYQPNEGVIEVRQKIAALVSLGAGFHPDLTGLENVYLNASIMGFARSEIQQKVQMILEFSELGDHIHQPVKNYSSGMTLRLGFSIAAHVDAPILILDEILGVGDEGFQKKSLDRMQALITSGRTIIMITHDGHSVLRWCTRCIVLEQGGVLHDGDVDAGVAKYSGLFL